MSLRKKTIKNKFKEANKINSFTLIRTKLGKVNNRILDKIHNNNFILSKTLFNNNNNFRILLKIKIFKIQKIIISAPLNKNLFKTFLLTETVFIILFQANFNKIKSLLFKGQNRYPNKINNKNNTKNSLINNNKFFKIKSNNNSSNNNMYRNKKKK
jgi:hypothetical protein